MAAMIAWNDRRRGRFEAELDRRAATLGRREEAIRRRDAALARAQAKLDRPLPRAALALDRLGRRFLRRIRDAGRTAARGSVQRRDPPPRTATLGGREASTVAVRSASRLRSGSADGATAGTPLRIGLVGATADGQVLEAALGGPTGGGDLEVSWIGSEEAAHDPGVDVLIAVSPSIRLTDLAQDRIRGAWVESLAAWEADPRLDDFDLVFSPEEDAAAIARCTTHVAVVVPPATANTAKAAIVDAVRAWQASPWIAIHISPKDWDVAPTWGDTLFARGVQRALRRAGWVVSIQVASEAEAPRATESDIALHIAGVSKPPVLSGQPTMLWVISHPDLLTARACEPYRIVFVASDPFAGELARRVRADVRVLHQATDPDRFFPEPGGPQHDVLFVGNSRHVKRPALAALAASPFSLAVYGGNWTSDLLDPSVVRGDWIANQELHRYYAGAAVVLSDHWPDMRDEGFISNRVYDALASGAFVVSDDVIGIGDRFDGAVATYADEAELLAVVGDAIAHPDERQRRAEHGRALVLQRDTFAHRAAAIIDGARSLGVATG